MNVLLLFFLKYLLAPLLAIGLTILLYIVAKQKAELNLKKLIIFMLLLILLLALPSLLGFLRYEFIWGGLVITICSYLGIGLLFNGFTTTKLFSRIGFKENRWLPLLALLPPVVIASWIYYFVFGWANQLGYELLAMLTPLWFLLPPLYVFSRDLYLYIPTPFYKPWIIDDTANDDEYWNNVDTFRLMQVTVKVKRDPEEQDYASFSVKLPEDVVLGQWFNRFVADQNIRFPNNAIVTQSETDAYGWIVYTHRWLPIPIFTRVLDFDSNVTDNRIKSNATLYVRRVSQSQEDEAPPQPVP